MLPRATQYLPKPSKQECKPIKLGVESLAPGHEIFRALLRHGTLLMAMKYSLKCSDSMVNAGKAINEPIGWIAQLTPTLDRVFGRN